MDTLLFFSFFTLLVHFLIHGCSVNKEDRMKRVSRKALPLPESLPE